MKKSLHNTTANGASKNVKDLQTWGERDMWKLICKASSESEGWMKSTKAMEIDQVGCLVQVTTQQLNETCYWPVYGPKDGGYPDGLSREDALRDSVIAEAVTFVPGVWIYEEKDEDGIVISRRLAAFP